VWNEEIQAMINDSEFSQAVTRMTEQKMTIYDQPMQFRPNDRVTREEAAKFFVNFAKNMSIESIGNKACAFNDLNISDTTLRQSLLDACERGIMKWNKGNIYPKNELTKAEAIAMLMRIQSGNKPETTTPWWLWYYREARVWWLTKETLVDELDRPMTRYEIALLLYRAWNKDLYLADDELEELKNIFTEFGVRIK
jgi:hypothetical protein